jgi:hypothetical protein
MADEPGRIEVELSLLSGRDSLAAEQLATSLGQIAKMFEAMKAVNFADQAERMAQLHAQMVADTERFREEGRAMQRRGTGDPTPAVTPPPAAPAGPPVSLPSSPPIPNVPAPAQGGGGNQPPVRPPAPPTGDNPDEDARKNAEEARNKNEETRKEEKARLAKEAEKSRVESPHSERVQEWMKERGLHPEQVEGDGGIDLRSNNFRIPRYGELNIQDYINIFRDRQLRQSLEADDPEKHLGRADFLNNASNAMGNVYAVRRFIQQAGTHLSAQGLNPMDEGPAMGYRRDSNPFSDILGIQTPFSQAGAEDLRRMRDTQRLRFSAGINNEQAQRISLAANQAGFTGDTAESLRMEVMGPAFRNFGINPESIIPLTQTLRTGTMSTRELADAISDLGETARAANLDVNQAAQQLAAAGEAAQQMGGSFQSGMNFGRTFMAGTGLPAEVGNRLAQNPMVQAFTAAQTGLPAMVQGALPPQARNEAMRTALSTMVQAYGGAFGKGVNTTTVDATTGERITEHTGGRDLAIGAAANALGINQDEAKAIMNRTNRQASIETTMARVTQYTEQGNKAEKSVQDQMLKRIAADKGGKASDYYFDKDGQVRQRTPENVRRAMEDVTGKKLEDKVVQSHLAGTVAGLAAKLVQDGKSDKNDNKTTWGELRASAHRAGVSNKDLDDARKLKDPAAQAKRVRQLVTEKAQESEAKYEIKFTGQAEKFFKALVKDNKNLPGADFDNAVAAASAPGPAPINPTGNTGLSPTIPAPGGYQGP